MSTNGRPADYRCRVIGSSYVSTDVRLPESTLKAYVPGVLFGIIFGAANAYLGLRAGLTISTSIPIAVMTVAAYKVLAAAGPRHRDAREERLGAGDVEVRGVRMVGREQRLARRHLAEPDEDAVDV